MNLVRDDTISNNALPFNNYITESSFELSGANLYYLNPGHVSGLLENSSLKKMLLKWLVRVCLWHSEQALKQENIEQCSEQLLVSLKIKTWQ